MGLISAKPGALRQTRFHEYALRFVFGGACTALAGWIAKEYGPTLGGLFLAFPAIFPASATLIASHERKRKQRAGMDGGRRGAQAAALDAGGACLGAVALVGFAVIVWLGLKRFSGWVVIPAATFGWIAIAIALWLGWKNRHVRRHTRHPQPQAGPHAGHALRRP